MKHFGTMKKRMTVLPTLLLFLLSFAAVGRAEVRVVATTTMLADLARVVGGPHVVVDGLMGPGIDPHLYQASAGDVGKMRRADVVVHNGLHLEGKMGDVFAALNRQNKTVICVADGIERTNILTDEGGVPDPHIWFDVRLWKDAAAELARGLEKADPDHAEDYRTNAGKYEKDLEDLQRYIEERVREVPEGQRVMVTAHDAFNYFGRAYGFEVRGLQGISTAAEAGTADVSALADFIVERKIKAVFVESSVPRKTIEALQAAVKARGFDVGIGGELYSDSLGGAGSGAETYISTVKANVDTITNALK